MSYEYDYNLTYDDNNYEINNINNNIEISKEKINAINSTDIVIENVDLTDNLPDYQTANSNRQNITHIVKDRYYFIRDMIGYGHIDKDKFNERTFVQQGEYDYSLYTNRFNDVISETRDMNNSYYYYRILFIYFMSCYVDNTNMKSSGDCNVLSSSITRRYLIFINNDLLSNMFNVSVNRCRSKFFECNNDQRRHNYNNISKICFDKGKYKINGVTMNALTYEDMDYIIGNSNRIIENFKNTCKILCDDIATTVKNKLINKNKNAYISTLFVGLILTAFSLAIMINDKFDIFKKNDGANIGMSIGSSGVLIIYCASMQYIYSQNYHHSAASFMNISYFYKILSVILTIVYSGTQLVLLAFRYDNYIFTTIAYFIFTTCMYFSFNRYFHESSNFNELLELV